MRTGFLSTLPRGSTLDEPEWRRRHGLLLILLLGHIPALAVIGGVWGRGIGALGVALLGPAVCALLGHLLRRRRRVAAVAVTLGLVSCSAALVALTGGAVEAHFHLFVVIAFVALYQDWVPLLGTVLFTTVSHVAGSLWQRDLIFNHEAGPSDPWLRSLVHGAAVLLAAVGIVLFCRVTEQAQERIAQARRTADAEVGRSRFAHDLLVNLARRNQSMLYRQLEIINQLEESERDPDTLAELFALDHLATRVRRNAESLLVLSGEQPTRVWSQPVALRDVLRAAIAETEDLQRVVLAADEQSAVVGHVVTDLTHLVAELIENAVRFSPPHSTVSIRARTDRQAPGGQVLTVEDSGVGMPQAQRESANQLLAQPSEVDLSVSQRLGLHVVARLAARHGIGVSLSATHASGTTATILLPATLFARPDQGGPVPAPVPAPAVVPASGDPTPTPAVPVLAVVPAIPDRPTPDRPTPDRPAPDRPAARPAAGPGADDQPPAGPARSTAPQVVIVPAPVLPHPPDTPAPPPSAGSADATHWLGWWAARVEPAPDGPGWVESVATDGAGPGFGAGADPGSRVPSPRPRAVPPPSPAGPRTAPSDGEPIDAGAGLRKRVPQSHLVPQLREPADDPGGSAGSAPGRSAAAAGALSRYRASRVAEPTVR